MTVHVIQSVRFVLALISGVLLGSAAALHVLGNALWPAVAAAGSVYLMAWLACVVWEARQ
jgi:uncharacterized membrane protein YedE/YeeE